MTLPKLFQEPGKKNANSRKTPKQGTGARCVNSQANRLMMALFPPNANNFKLSPDGADLGKMAEQAGLMQGEIEMALAEVERTIVNDIETSIVRGPLSIAFQHGVATGNFCVQIPDEGPAKVYPLMRYVVDRDGMGSILEIITLDSISEDKLDLAVRALIGVKEGEEKSGESKEHDLYTRVALSLKGDMWEVFQEIEGKVIPGTEGTYPVDACPWIVVALNPTEGEDYGTGQVWDYIGDFEGLEALRVAIRKGAAAAAKILWALDPNSPTRERTITEAESGAVIRMRGSDLTAVQLDKFGDMQFARQEADSMADKLEMIFGVRTSIQRNGERVTTEEIRYMAQELEEGSAGLYALMSEAFLLPMIRRYMARLQRQGRLPELPANIAKPRITVGMAALGRGQDQQKLVQFAQSAKEVLGDQFAARVNVGEWLARLGAAADINTKGLVKTDDEIAADQQNATMNEGLVRAAPQIAGAFTQPDP